MTRIHICPILMKTVMFVDDNCGENLNKECPVQEKIKHNALEDTTN